MYVNVEIAEVMIISSIAVLIRITCNFRFSLITLPSRLGLVTNYVKAKTTITHSTRNPQAISSTQQDSPRSKTTEFWSSLHEIAMGEHFLGVWPGKFAGVVHTLQRADLPLGRQKTFNTDRSTSVDATRRDTNFGTET